jgi:hypothetical protein
LTKPLATATQRNGVGPGHRWEKMREGMTSIFGGQSASLFILQISPFNEYSRYSVLPALSLDGVLHLDVLEGSYNAVKFNSFIEILLDNMNKFPGPNSVIVMDNASIHKSAALRPMIEERYVFPYSLILLCCGF